MKVIEFEEIRWHQMSVLGWQRKEKAGEEEDEIKEEGYNFNTKKDCNLM